MDTKLRPSGITGLGEMPWGTHFCLFYETKEDLLDTLVPYFKAGLEHNEYCVWVIADALTEADAWRALSQAVPAAERYRSNQSIELIQARDWYLNVDHFELDRVMSAWNRKLMQALARGYVGMRVSGDTLWLEKKTWQSFLEYEDQLDESITDQLMTVLCTYPLISSGAAEILDVARKHQFALARRGGALEVIETSELKQAKAEITRLNADLERRVEERTIQLATTNEELRQEISERKRTEEALYASERRLQAAIDAAHIGLWDWDLVSGKIIWFGHHEELFGFAPGEFDGTYLSFEKRVHPEDLEEMNKVVQHARDDRSEYAHEYRIIWPDGSIHWINGRGKFIYNETRQPVRMSGAVLDITERKQAEEALRKSEGNFRTLADKSLQGIAIFQDQKIVYANPAQSAVLGYTIEELKSMSVEQIIALTHPIDRPTALERVRKRIAGEELSQFIEVRILRKDGSSRWIQSFNNLIEYNGQPAVLTASIDITERKQAESTIRSLLQISEKLTATLNIDVLLDSLVIEAIKLIDAEIGWSGLRTEEGMVCHTHIGRDLQVIPFKYLWPPGVGLPGWVLANKVPYVMNDAQSDKLIIPEIRARFGVKAAIDTPILDAQGEVIGFFEVNNKKNGARFSESDVEKLVAVSRIASIALQNAMSYANLERAEKALRESQLQLQQLSRQLLQVQEAERRAITTELHDRVGQNLTGLSINLQNMKALLSGEATQILGVKFDDAQALVEDITRQIRDIMAELHLPELEEYGLAAALEIYAERAASRGNLELIADLTDLTPPRLSSNVRIALFRSAQEAIINVLRHADATQLAVSLLRENGRVRLRVEDNGRGFDPNAASQKEAPSWGLKIMRERIESIGGKVQIESEPGHGTRVTFEIERHS
jgi:PAS domain S-box-containing protein